jgi:hypothetical protein
VTRTDPGFSPERPPAAQPPWKLMPHGAHVYFASQRRVKNAPISPLPHGVIGRKRLPQQQQRFRGFSHRNRNALMSFTATSKAILLAQIAARATRRHDAGKDGHLARGTFASRSGAMLGPGLQ